ncbi:MAG TPA: Do family serine endopeptidase [Gammaproteobacteria bacterium]|nr:Do family serine endopeptidase [Gammaproteobacteria bacterium]
MSLPRAVVFASRFITIGLAVAFIVLFFYPGLRPTSGPAVVEIHETAVPEGATVPIQKPVLSYADAVARAAPAVVNVYTQKVVRPERNPLFDDPFFRRFFGDQFGRPRERLETSLGSGVIFSDQGYIITNNHVIAGADEIEVALRDGRSLSARIVGRDPDTDLAVLKIDLDHLPAITLGDSDKLRVGDVVLAIGNPFGVGQTVTSGIVSATGRDMLGLNTFENFIQTDAAINPGNSGGALISANGELIGINTAIFSRSGGSQGIGFAIPVNLVKDVMTQIIEHGQVVRGWLGVAVQDLTPELAESFGLPEAKGVVVSNIVVNGPADEAGLDRGDVITRINGQEVDNVRKALDLITRAKPGETITITVIRGGREKEFKARVLQRPLIQE